jgi:baculoviral IAP repeat-containing protein 7/8
MDSFNNRLMSFKKWPPNHPLTPHELAYNGFYHLGDDDEVRCAFCKVQICRWQENDNVEADHKRWAPQCKLVRGLVDVNGGSTSEPVVVSSIDECGARPKAIVAHPQYRTYNSRIVTFRNKWPVSIPITPHQLAVAGFFYTGVGDKVKCFTCDGGLNDWKAGDDAFKEHARWFDRCNYIIKAKGREFIQKVATEACVVKENQDAVLSATAPLLHQIEEEEKVCKICFENPRDVCFSPCGHVVSCYACALSVDHCPLCRCAHDNIQKLYFS